MVADEYRGSEDLRVERYAGLSSYSTPGELTDKIIHCISLAAVNKWPYRNRRRW